MKSLLGSIIEIIENENSSTCTGSKCTVIKAASSMFGYCVLLF